MDKQTTLQSLKDHVVTGDITRHDVDQVFKEVAETKGESKSINFAQVLYYVGAIIVLIGIFVLVGQHWSELSAFTRILVTLGSGVVSYAVAVLFMQKPQTKQVSTAFFLLSAILIPFGLGVMFDNAGFDVGDAGIQLTISLIVAALFGLSYFVYRKNVTLFFVIAFATWAFYAFMNLILNGNPVAWTWNLYTYITMIVGVAYILLGYAFEKTVRRELTGPLYFFGVLGFLGAAITLDGFWEVIYAGLALGAILLSTKLRSRSFLIFGALFLMGYLVKITAKYFSDSMGWPLALVLAGLMLIAVGYFTFYLNKKYLTNNEAVRS